jgi:hypothetical protein
MILDITKVQLNPIPLPIVELQEQNVILKGKNKVFENVILGVIGAGTLLLIYYVIKYADERHKKQN